MRFALENGIIDLKDVQEKIEMKKREEYLAKHVYEIWKGKDGKWRTYLPDSNLGRKLIKRVTQIKVENAVVNYYQKEEEKEVPVTFEIMYSRWRKVQDILVSDNTVEKYKTDFNRYFKDTDFAKEKMEHITEESIKVFMCETVKNKKLCKKACKTLFGYIRNTIYSARINHVIVENPTEYLEAKQFYKYCEEKERPMECTIVSDSDMRKLYMRFRDDYEKKPSYIPTYAVELASLTGMRVGEISALAWENITEKYIIVKQSERYNRKTRQYYIASTKNGKDRIFPVTPEIKNLLERVKRIELQWGYISEWVFSDKDGRIHAPVISSCSKCKCKQIGITEKGIHAYRRTINSKLRCGGVSATVAAALLGHSEDVNEKYYTFDVSGIEEKTEIVSKINAEMPIAN